MKLTFRQDTPAHQLVVVYQAMWGMFSNYREGIISKERFESFHNDYLGQFQKILLENKDLNVWTGSKDYEVEDNPPSK